MKVTLNNARLAFPALWQARTADPTNPSAKAKYSATFIVSDKTTASAEIGGKVIRGPAQEVMKQVLQAAAQEKWTDKGPTILKQLQAGGKTCYRSGDDKTQYAGFEGNWYLSSSSDARPTVIDRDRSPLQPGDGRPYGGCYVNAKIDVWPQDNQFGKRINAQLRGVQFAQDGEAFGGGTPASADEFEELEPATAADDGLFD